MAATTAPLSRTTPSPVPGGLPLPERRFVADALRQETTGGLLLLAAAEGRLTLDELHIAEEERDRTLDARAAADDAGVLRVVIDQVASLTDGRALAEAAHAPS